MIVDDQFRGTFIKGLPESVETQPATREALIYFAIDVAPLIVPHIDAIENISHRRTALTRGTVRLSGKGF
jgi:hypothetical protein